MEKLDKNFGNDIDKKNINKDDHFYLTPKEFQDFIEYVLYQYMFWSINQSTKIIYNQKNDKVVQINNEAQKRYIYDLLKPENIDFNNNGFIYIDEKGEKAYISPEFFTLQLCENLKRNPEAAYFDFKRMQEQIGIDNLNEIDFKKQKEELKKYYSDLQVKSKGLYRLTEEYNEWYLRAIENCSQIEESVIETKNDIVDYFSDEFEPYNDKEFRKIDDELDERINQRSREDRIVEENGKTVHYIDTEYLDFEEQIITLREKAEKEAYNRYKSMIARNIKIAINEYIRILENKLKSKIISYKYKEAEQKLGHITELGLDFVSYYAHPSDKYNLERRCDYVSGYEPEDYDEMYIGNLNEDENIDTVIRHINL